MKKLLSVIFFSYNRSGYLGHCLERFLKRCPLPLPQYEIIVADDGSTEPHRKKIKKLATDYRVDKLLMLAHNGMGVSFNTGIKAAEGEFVLHLEDDWELTESPMALTDAIHILQHNPSVAMVRLSHPQKDLSERALLEKCGCANCQTELKIMPNHSNMYSNNPHLKRADFHRNFHYYAEGQRPPDTENDFRIKAMECNLKICWAGDIFVHIGQYTASGAMWPNFNNEISLLYQPLIKRDDVWQCIETALNAQEIFAAEHYLQILIDSKKYSTDEMNAYQAVHKLCEEARASDAFAKSVAGQTTDNF